MDDRILKEVGDLAIEGERQLRDGGERRVDHAPLVELNRRVRLADIDGDLLAALADDLSPSSQSTP
jgi:hypothetical protein